MRTERRAIAINSGELFVTRSSSDYFLNISEGYEGLALTFDAGAHPAWLNLVERGEKELVRQAEQCCGGLGGRHVGADAPAP